MFWLKIKDWQDSEVSWQDNIIKPFHLRGVKATNTLPMKVLWYNATSESYESGTWNDFKHRQSNTTHPEEILALERFYDTSTHTIRKIAMELNKCRLGRQR